MNFVKKFLPLFFVLVLILYVSGVFINGTFGLSTWTEQSRNGLGVTLVILSFIFSIGVAMSLTGWSNE